MNKDKIYILAITIVIVLFLFREGCNRMETNKLVADITSYKTESETYKTKLGLEINTNRALALETQDQMKSLLASNDTMREWVKEFKEIKGGVIIKETTIIKEVAVPFDRKRKYGNLANEKLRDLNKVSDRVFDNFITDFEEKISKFNVDKFREYSFESGDQIFYWVPLSRFPGND